MPTDQKSSRVGDCPLEQKIAQALDSAGVDYRTEFEGKVPEGLDFYLAHGGIHIEVKGAHAPRIADQMARSKNVIVAQGEKAVDLLAFLIRQAARP